MTDELEYKIELGKKNLGRISLTDNEGNKAYFYNDFGGRIPGGEVRTPEDRTVCLLDAQVSISRTLAESLSFLENSLSRSERIAQIEAEGPLSSAPKESFLSIFSSLILLEHAPLMRGITLNAEPGEIPKLCKRQDDKLRSR